MVRIVEVPPFGPRCIAVGQSVTGSTALIPTAFICCATATAVLYRAG